MGLGALPSTSGFGPEDFGGGIEADGVGGGQGGETGALLIERVAAEFLAEGGGEFDEEDALDDDAGTGDRAGVGALVGGLRVRVVSRSMRATRASGSNALISSSIFSVPKPRARRSVPSHAGQWRGNGSV